MGLSVSRLPPSPPTSVLTAPPPPSPPPPLPAQLRGDMHADDNALFYGCFLHMAGSTALPPSPPPPPPHSCPAICTRTTMPSSTAAFATWPVPPPYRPSPPPAQLRGDMHADDNALFYGCFRHMAASRSSDDLRQVCARQLPAAARAASVVTPGAYQVGRGQGGGGGDLRQVCTRQLPTAAGAGSFKAFMAAYAAASAAQRGGEEPQW